MESRKVHVQDGVGNEYDLIEADGTLFPDYFAEDPVQRLIDVKSMTGKDDDVIIAAYPKAGTHWVWEIANMLLQGSAEYHTSMKEAQMLELTGSSGADALDSPRVFNTHLRFEQLPADMIKRNCKIIYVTRNPKDMAVSRYCHNVKGSVGYKGTFTNYLPLYMDGKVAFGSWFDYTIKWNTTLREEKDYPIHTVCYELLKRDTLNQVQKLADFLGVKIDQSVLQDICDKCDFNKLKEGYINSKKLFDEKENPLSYTFRKGEIGDWKNWFTVAQNEQFDGALQTKMAEISKTFIYE
ncbi:sulfotransferase 1C2-like [Mercenaria mercenaria]|uniref:sulfotransferase 1C2-like n=1 Tax=Mercenaria mercenaria TaxID=6596 RepID=UPI00234EB4FE|nr:sulfotransferase 1C2-like [Mercenaria mercenaria]